MDRGYCISSTSESYEVALLPYSRVLSSLRKPRDNYKTSKELVFNSLRNDFLIHSLCEYFSSQLTQGCPSPSPCGSMVGAYALTDILGQGYQPGWTVPSRPSQGANGRQPMNVSFSRTDISPMHSLKINGGRTVCKIQDVLKNVYTF